jgi:hypothetical protein
VYTGFWWGNLRERVTWKSGRRWGDNITMDLKEVGCVGMDWISLAHDRDRRQALQKEAMNFRVT